MDPQIQKLIQEEEERQLSTINLIASENYPSKAVRAAMGCIFDAKYSEGRPGKRYYAGIGFIDELETLVEDRVRTVFNIDDTWAVNVQPLSGSPANYAIQRGLLSLGDPILSLDLSHGGHLSHGAPVSLTGKDFVVSYYHVEKESGLINYEELLEVAKENRPKLIIAGYSAYPRVVDFKRIADIAHSVGAFLLADISHITGLIISNQHPSPFPHADVVMTTTHKSLRGPRGALIVCREELKEKIFPAVFPGLQGGPHNNTIAALGVALSEAQSSSFKEYGENIIKNAQKLASSLTTLGVTLVSGGTDNHLMLIDVTPFNMRGKEAQIRLESAGIVVNRNAIPFDPHPPFDPSGIRIGTPAITTRGMKEEHMSEIATWLYKVLSDESSAEGVRSEVSNFAKKFPLP